MHIAKHWITTLHGLLLYWLQKRTASEIIQSEWPTVQGEYQLWSRIPISRKYVAYSEPPTAFTNYLESSWLVRILYLHFQKWFNLNKYFWKSVAQPPTILFTLQIPPKLTGLFKGGFHGWTWLPCFAAGGSKTEILTESSSAQGGFWGIFFLPKSTGGLSNQ